MFINFSLYAGSTVTRLAQWITTQCIPSGTVKNASRESASHKSPRQISTSFGIKRTDLSLGNTKAFTLSPLSNNWLQTLLPKNPAAPVTK